MPSLTQLFRKNPNKEQARRVRLTLIPFAIGLVLANVLRFGDGSLAVGLVIAGLVLAMTVGWVMFFWAWKAGRDGGRHPDS